MKKATQLPKMPTIKRTFPTKAMPMPFGGGRPGGSGGRHEGILTPPSQLYNAFGEGANEVWGASPNDVWGFISYV